MYINLGQMYFAVSGFYVAPYFISDHLLKSSGFSERSVLLVENMSHYTFYTAFTCVTLQAHYSRFVWSYERVLEKQLENGVIIFLS